MKKSSSKKKSRKTNKAKCPKSLKIMLVGEGGQGIQTVAKVTAKTAFQSDYHVSYIPNFGTEQRGGISIGFVRISCDPIVSPKFQTADVFVIVTSRNFERTLRYIGKKTSVIYDPGFVSAKIQKQLKKKTDTVASVDAFKYATESLTERSFNIVILGLVTGLVDPDMTDKALDVMDEKFDKYYKKKPELKDLNHKAFEYGFKLTQG